MPIQSKVTTLQTAFLYLEDNTEERLEFQLVPDEIAWNKAAEYASVPILGRSEPIRVYSSSTTKIFNLTLGFMASVDGGDDGVPESEIDGRVRWCESLVYPEVKGGVYLPTPTVIFVFGTLIDVRCVCTNVAPVIKGPWTTPDLTSYHAIISLTLEEVSDRLLSSSEVRT